MTPARRYPETNPEPLARFVLPLTVAPLQNKYARMHWFQRSKLKREAFMRLLAQGAERRDEPLPGKPTVRITRQSSVPCDPDSGLGAKIVLDCLKADKQGLGIIRDDGPEAIKLELRWERAAPSRGQVIVEVYG